MAIEKMIMINLVGSKKYLDKISKYLVLFKFIHIVNAFDEIKDTDFKLYINKNNIEAIKDMSYIKPYSENFDYSDTLYKIKRLRKIIDLDNLYKIKMDDFIIKYSDIKEELNNIFLKISYVYDNLNNKMNKKNKIKKDLQILSCLKQINIPLEEFTKLNNFDFKLYYISNENILKLKNNYHSISSVILKSYNKNNIIMTFTPVVLIKERDRILKSLNCKSIKLSYEYTGIPKNIIKDLKSKLKYLKEEISQTNKNLHDILKENSKRLYIIDRSMDLEREALKIKEKVACTEKFFYLCGWIPENLKVDFKNLVNKFKDKLIIIEKSPEDMENKYKKIPTKLKNNFIVKPFEVLVNMYGVPSYNEIDPTLFLGISYMIMFGAMFGDIGQGFIFFLIGLFLKYKKRKSNFGGVLSRLGISSSIFGLLYGEVFGFEIISALFIRPMNNVEDILFISLIFGCCFLTIGYVYSLVNNIKKKDIENGIFGRNGIVGFLFYILLIIFIFTKIANIEVMATTTWSIIFVNLLIIMFLKQPISNFIKNKRPLFSDNKSDYIIEHSFGIIETVISLFSNTLSFIRVGAFALNHIGLFIAFAAIANMMNNVVESISIYILANIIIMGLEGLIVFIQGLRLEYYEIFSKYYEGSGFLFKPVQLTKYYK